MTDSVLNLEQKCLFVNNETDKAWLKVLTAHVEDCRKRDVALVPGGTAPSELRRRVALVGRVDGRRQDWRLTESSSEHDACLVLMVTRWSGEGNLSVGLEFVTELSFHSCVKLRYEDAWSVVSKSLTNLRKGEYSCGVCFDTKRVVVLGQGCCGNQYCTDVCNADVEDCPTCGNDPYFQME